MPSNAVVPDTVEVLNYVRSLEYGLKQSQTRSIDLELLREMHQLLMEGAKSTRITPEQFRIEQKLHLSPFFEKRREEYFNLLLGVTERGIWREWVLFFLEAVTEQSRDTIKRAQRLLSLRAEWYSRILHVGASPALLRLVDKLFDQLFDLPITTVLESNSYKTAQRSIQKLMDAGILQSWGGQEYRREFVAREILDILLEDSDA